MKLERYGVIDEIAEKNKIMLDFDYTRASGMAERGLLSRRRQMGRGSSESHMQQVWDRLPPARRRAVSASVSRARARGPNLIGIITSLRLCGLRARSIQYQRTRKGWHVIIFGKLRRRLSPAEIVALQFCLGSDRRRETLNLMRVLKLDGKSDWEAKRWNLMFSEKIT